MKIEDVKCPHGVLMDIDNKILYNVMGGYCAGTYDNAFTNIKKCPYFKGFIDKDNYNCALDIKAKYKELAEVLQ